MNIEGLWDRTYGLSSLSEETRDVITKAALSPQLFKDPSQVGPAGVELTASRMGTQCAEYCFEISPFFFRLLSNASSDFWVGRSEKGKKKQK